MSWNLGLYLSESFAELTAHNSSENKKASKFWYLRTKSLMDGLNEFFTQNGIGDGSQIKISTFWPEMVVQKSLGTPPALLVSAGFEDWLHLRQPKKSNPPAIPPERHRSFFSSDYIFGISERTDAEGKIHKAPTAEDLEFLHQKFLLTNKKNIAIGFLHSARNPQNEKMVANFFREREYKVWASHEYGGGLNEVSRWWRAGLEAYVFNTLEEMNAPLVQFCKEKGVKLNLSDIDNLGAGFEMFNRVKGLYGKTPAAALLWADLRAFHLIDLKSEQKFTETLWGPIAGLSPRMKPLKLKPTSLIENEGLRGLRRDFFDIGFDPGPMAFGRGIKPTVFDVLYGFDLLSVAPEISAFINPTSKPKINESLAIAMRVLLKNEAKWQEFLIGWIRTQIVSEIVEFAGPGEIYIAGPLAASLKNLFDNRKLHWNMKLIPDSDWCGSSSALSSLEKSLGL